MYTCIQFKDTFSSFLVVVHSATCWLKYDIAQQVQHLRPSLYFFYYFEGNSLVFLTFHLLNQYGLIELFQLDMVKLRRFLGEQSSVWWW